jgi:hypothetical protein
VRFTSSLPPLEIQEFLLYIKHLFEILMYDPPKVDTSSPSYVICVPPLLEAFSIMNTSFPLEVVVSHPLLEDIPGLPSFLSIPLA